VRRTLKRYSNLARQALLGYLPDDEPSRYLYGLLPDYPLRPGKGLRPALCLATCQAFGGSLDDAIDAAVSIELLHNAFLVHDDIADESVRRRGRPTLHRAFGVPLALNAGDALALLSTRPLMAGTALSRQHDMRLLEMFQETVTETLEGQAEDLGWVRDNVTDLTAGDYLRVTLKKTGWYTVIHPCRAGAHIGSRGTVNPDRFLRFGFFLGSGFQLRDDLLGVRGDGPDETAGEDLLEGKRTLMLIHLLRVAPQQQQAFVRDFLRRPRAERDRDEAMEIIRLMRLHGSVRYAERWLRSLARRADEEFVDAFSPAPDSEHTRFIRGLVPHLMSLEVGARGDYPQAPAEGDVGVR
jgi:geranylgeranyl diphosphate synthase type II